MNHIKICLVGAGKWGKNHLKTLKNMGNLYGIVETDKTKYNDLQKKYPNIEIYENIHQTVSKNFDGYIIATPAASHYEIASELIKIKKHVLIEKPMTLNSADAKKLVDSAKKNKVQIMVGHVMLYHPAIIKIKELLLNDKIGKLQYLYSNRLNLGTVRTEENVFWSFAPHDISIFQYFTESYPIKIDSSGGCFLQPEIHDTSLTIFNYPENIHAHIFVSWLHPFKEHRIVIIGSKGMISFEDSSQEKNIIYYPKGIFWQQGKPIKKDGPSEIIPYEKTEPLKNELKNFIQRIKNPDNLYHGKDGLEVIQILETATQTLLKKNK